MKTRHAHRLSRIQNKKRPSTTDSQPQLERLLVLSKWLLIIPVVMLLLFSCGQIGILTSRKIAKANTQTNMEADYGPWSYVLVYSLKPEIIEEIIRDKPMEDGEGGTIPGTSEGDMSWVDTNPNATSIPDLNPTSIPTALRDHQPTPSDTPQQTPSPLPTQITAIPTTAPTNTLVDNPPTPTQPPTEIPPLTATPSPTSPPSMEPVTFWMSGEGSLGRYKLVTSQPNGPARQRNISAIFTTDPFADNAFIESGQTTIYFFATNSSDQSITVGIILEAGLGKRSFPIGGTEMTIPPNTTTPTLLKKTFSTLGYHLSSNNTLRLSVLGGIHVTIYWDGEWNDSHLVVPPITP
jgi:hypothetical protein